MAPEKKDIKNRYLVIMLALVLLGLCIIIKAGVIMFAERQYWNDVADRFVKENVSVPAMRGNIISSDGQLMASSLPEYRIYMDFKAGGPDKDSLLMKVYLDSICEGLHKIFPDRTKAQFRQQFIQGHQKMARHFLIYPKESHTLSIRKSKNYRYLIKGKTEVDFTRRPITNERNRLVHWLCVLWVICTQISNWVQKMV